VGRGIVGRPGFGSGERAIPKSSKPEPRLTVRKSAISVVGYTKSMPHRSNAVRLFRTTRGRGQPFIMLHDSPGDHYRAMAHVENAFRGCRGWCRIYPDLPGHGRSPGSPRIRDMDDYLDAVIDFVDDVTRGGPFAIGGSSFGGYLALGVARKRAARLTGLLIGVPEIHHSPREDRLDAAFGGPSQESYLEAVPGLPPYLEDTDWLKSLPFRDVKPDLYRRGSPIRAPALFLLGRQDAPFRYRAYWKMTENFPRATFAVLDGAGHGLWSERSKLSAALVGDWLERIQQ
jgi:pimeloyl-ACP methyl ester carboxylesterase